MISKPSTCQACPLYSKGQGFCPDKIAPKPRIKFIGEAPGTSEISKNPPEPFVGRAGIVMKNWLLPAVMPLKLAWERGEVTIENTLRCLPPEIQGRPYPKGQEKLDAEACCRQYDSPMDGIQTVVLFGESPQRVHFRAELEAEDAEDRALGHEVKGVTGRIGRVYEKDGRRYVFAPHPAYILRQPALVGHGQESLRIAAGTEKMMEPAFVPWGTAMRVVL